MKDCDKHHRVVPFGDRVERHELDWDVCGVSVVGHTRKGKTLRKGVDWHRVCAVDAYVVQAGGEDLVCLSFDTGHALLQAHEEMEGWEALLGVLAEHLEAFPASGTWYREVLEGVAPNVTRLWTSA